MPMNYCERCDEFMPDDMTMEEFVDHMIMVHCDSFTEFRQPAFSLGVEA